MPRVKIVPRNDRELRTLASRNHRGCFGKSSGGYGSIIHGMRYPGTWGAIADHSGDAYFDFVYGSEWPDALTELAKYRPRPFKGPRYDERRMERGTDRGYDDGRVRRFLDTVASKQKLSDGDSMTMMTVCMAATYDPDPRARNGFRLPYKLETGERLEARWRAWQAHDPIDLVARYKSNLKTLRGIYIERGYHIRYGRRILSKRLDAARIPHTYQESDDDHSDVDYHMDISPPFLSRALR